MQEVVQEVVVVAAVAVVVAVVAIAQRHGNGLGHLWLLDHRMWLMDVLWLIACG